MSVSPLPNCEFCQGSGWVFNETARGYSGAQRCGCVIAQLPPEKLPGPKPALKEFMAVVKAWAELIPFFPQSSMAHKIIVASLEKFVESDEALRWLGQAVTVSISKWQGIAAIRALYATKYKLKDGPAPATVDENGQARAMVFPGFTNEELEARYTNQMMEESDKRLEQYRHQALTEGQSPFPLPEVKRLQ